MDGYGIKTIAKAIGGKPLPDADPVIDTVCTDTRAITPGCLFLALEGERFDGHDFIAAAFEKGAAAAVAHKPVSAPGPVLYVDDTRAAYLRLAGWYRAQCPAKVVGVTGSVGKTTAKEMIYAVLSSRLKTLKTRGNFNNEIGLPRTLLELSKDDQTAVIEMGMSHFGEIERLAKTARPDVGVITNVGVSHIENLGSRENILKAKLEILSGMAPDAPIITNADDDLLSKTAFGTHPVLLCGIDAEKADVKAAQIAAEEGQTAFEIQYQGRRYRASIPALGRHNVLNALFGFAAGVILGIPPKEAAAALSHYAPAGMRQAVSTQNGVTVIADCYNASPDSMRAALSVLCEMPGKGRRVAVLGDMLELGEHAPQAHRAVGRTVAAMPVDLLVCCGVHARLIAQAAAEAGHPNAVFFEEKKDAAAYLRAQLKPGDAVIFKASRGMRFETMIEETFGGQDNR